MAIESYTPSVNDLWKSSIEHLGWPVIILVVFLFLRKQIVAVIDQATELFKRANLLSLRHKETTLEARAEVVSQTKETEGIATNAGLGAGTNISAPLSPVSTDQAARRESVRDYGKQVPAVQEREAAIRLALEEFGFPLS